MFTGGKSAFSSAVTDPVAYAYSYMRYSFDSMHPVFDLTAIIVHNLSQGQRVAILEGRFVNSYRWSTAASNSLKLSRDSDGSGSRNEYPRSLELFARMLVQFPIILL